jgi:hypothetical protein
MMRLITPQTAEHQVVLAEPHPRKTPTQSCSFQARGTNRATRSPQHRAREHQHLCRPPIESKGADRVDDLLRPVKPAALARRQ